MKIIRRSITKNHCENAYITRYICENSLGIFCLACSKSVWVSIFPGARECLRDTQYCHQFCQRKWLRGENYHRKLISFRNTQNIQYPAGWKWMPFSETQIY